MNFLFWNINKKNNFFDVIRDVLYTEDIDILMIAEYPLDDPEELLSIINRPPSTYQYEYLIPNATYDKVKIFTRFKSSLIEPKMDKPRLSAKQFLSPLLNQYITFVTCHLPSKVNMANDELSEYAEEVKEFIEDVEENVGHKRTIVCGDFNMNPFDNGIIKARGLHAVMEKSIAQRGKAKIRNNDYDFFYNPMWGFLGDNGCGSVSGTMYYNSCDSINYYWHLYDQVLIRPELISIFDSKKLEIITNIKEYTLLTSNGIIDKEKYSDHLPIKFNLKI
ncbi:hypothetical protein R3O55_012750 [Bacteroides hominis]|uniref:hypothetical protein n=1 Tax=Bacteroides hominis TaxID=2763023 RepID=UPI002949DED0|nr:hypothetical protein [Bacteroides hominis (ex Liu et al. 2022)]MDV6135768.1 hypothetical protein [Bacteroides hominis (ex Liu et al. 2022)]MDV6153123.1 hypothetical protein [Bacteroides hominis (ex Liu et al. 2022)]